MIQHKGWVFSLAILIPFIFVCAALPALAAGDGDPFAPEKQKAVDFVVNNLLGGKTDTVEIIINEVPRIPDVETVISDLNGEVEQPEGWAWLVVIDEVPGSYRHHPTRWVFVNRHATKILLVLDKETLPRLFMSRKKILFDVAIDYVTPQQPIPQRKIPEAPPASDLMADYTYDNYYAVIIEGDIPSGDSYNEFWLDNVIMYQTLIEKGYLPENIHVLYGYGDDETSFPCDWYLETMVDFPAYQQDVRNIFTWMRDGNPELGITKVTANDFIYLYTFDHGGSSGSCNATLCLMDGCMADTEFASYFNDIPYKHRAVVMQQCNSGGFIDNLQNATTVVTTAANCYESAWEGNEAETCNYHTMHHGEFNYWHMSAMRGHKPKPGEEPVDQDRNADGKVSFYEAYQYVMENDSAYENPQYSDPGNLGDSLSLQAWSGPTLRYQSSLIDDSGPYGNNDGVAGPGETVKMPITLHNMGNETAVNPTATLGMASQTAIRILDQQANYPNILAKGTGTSITPHYEISIDPAASCGTMADMALNITADQCVARESTFTLPIGKVHDDYASADTPLTIPKKTTGTLSTRAVSDSFVIKDITVSVDVTHGDAGELRVILRSPAGTEVTLHNKSHVGTADINTTYDTARAPDGPGTMNDFNGQNPQGSWILTIIDDVAGSLGAGRLNSWTLHIEAIGPFSCVPLNCGEPAPASIGNSLKLTKENQSDLRLSWDSLAGAGDYRIWKSANPDFADAIFVGKTTGGAASYVETGALNDPTMYLYEVRALNSCNQEGP